MIDQLIHRIKVRQAELKESLAAGAAFNWETYQRMVGEHLGLQATLDMLDNMMDEQENRE